MGNQVSLVPKVSYEDIQMVVYRNTHIPHSTLIINTLPPSLQHCLIKTTVDIGYEEQIVNTMIHKNRDIMIIVYGKNSNDITILHKYEQLVKLGFTNVHIYTGGIFEWMLLYEIYGKDLFKITRYEIDILRYRPKSVLLAAMAGGGGAGAGAGAYIEDIQRSHDVRINIPVSASASADEDVSNHDTHTPENSNGSLFTGLKWLFS
jgi:rhodanese-related sulfurtransferase